MNSPAAIAITKNRIAAWWTMNDQPAFMSIQIWWMRLVDEPAGASSDAGRTIATDAIRLADTRKLITSIA